MKRFKFDFYPTPPSCVSAIFKNAEYHHQYIFKPMTGKNLNVLDTGAGTGIWGKVLRQQLPVHSRLQLWGIDLQKFEKPPEYDYWLSGIDFLSEQGNLLLTEKSFDVVMGNPPYKHAEEFIKRSLDLTKRGGYVIMLTRLSFLESIGRATGLFDYYTPQRVTVLARRPSFHLDRKTGSRAFCVLTWKKNEYDTTELDWMLWNYEDRWDGVRREAREHLIDLGAFNEHLESKK